jgi:hypothetical protein
VPTLEAEVATQTRIALEPDGLVAVLDHVRAHGAASRAQLAQATGLGRSVLTSGSTRCSTTGCWQRIASVSRRAVGRRGCCASAPTRAILLVADLGATSTDVALADLAGEIVVHRRRRPTSPAGPDAVLAASRNSSTSASPGPA